MASPPPWKWLNSAIFGFFCYFSVFFPLASLGNFSVDALESAYLLLYSVHTKLADLPVYDTFNLIVYPFIFSSANLHRKSAR